jgi:hypothetical protein
VKIKIQNSIFFTTILILIFIFINMSGVGFSQLKKGGEIGQLVETLHRLTHEKSAKGYDVSRVIDLESRAKEAVRSGNTEEGMRLINQALEAVRELNPNDKEKTVTSYDRGELEQRRDSRKTKTIELGIPAKEVIYTVAVPSLEFERSNQKKDSKKAFESKKLEVVDGKLLLQLDDRPVFLEMPSNKRGEASLINNESSPFGLLIDKPSYSKELADINVKWVRLSGLDGLVWAIAEPEKGKFDFTKLDSSVQQFYEKGFNLLITVSSFNLWDQYGHGTVLDEKNPEKNKKLVVWRLPKDLQTYSNFLQRAVERYDGDGIDDAPGSPVVKYWQIHNELDFFWKDSPEHFAELLKVSYLAIKKASSQAQVVIGGIGGVNSEKGFNFYASVVRHLQKIKDHPNDRYFDVFDLHWMSTAKGYKQFLNQIQGVNLGDFLDRLRKLLNSSSYTNIPIFMTEVSTFSSCPNGSGKTIYCQTEEEQATGLLKLLVYPLSKGVSKVFWVSLHEFHHFAGKANGVFDNVGLIYNPENNGKTGKKLAFYSYQLLIEKTQGADWNTLKEINTGTKDVHLYKVMKNKNPFYIVWWDSY